MADTKPDQSASETGLPNPAVPSKKPVSDAEVRDALKVQMDEASDEGAGKLSVPVDEVTTSNDK